MKKKIIVGLLSVVVLCVAAGLIWPLSMPVTIISVVAGISSAFGLAVVGKKYVLDDLDKSRKPEVAEDYMTPIMEKPKSKGRFIDLEVAKKMGKKWKEEETEEIKDLESIM